MKQYPTHSAENAELLGAWRQPATNVCIPLRSRRAWHKARRQGRLGEQIDRAFEQRYGVKESRAAARNMTVSTTSATPKPLFDARSHEQQALDFMRRS